MNIALFGPTGRTGSEIVNAVRRRQEKGENIRIVSGVVGPASLSAGKRIDGIDEPLICAAAEVSKLADVVIDFSTPAGSEAAIQLCQTRLLPGVICTTALGEAGDAAVRRTAGTVPVVRATNTSVAVAVLVRLAEEATKLLGADFDVELVELHHRGKRDAPSGTALTVLEHVAAARGISLGKVLTQGRAGHDVPRAKGELGAQALRGGDAAGEHTVYFLGDGERVEITQRATSRRVYAEGAIRAAAWVGEKQRAAGLYSMLDVLANTAKTPAASV